MGGLGGLRAWGGCGGRIPLAVGLLLAALGAGSAVAAEAGGAGTAPTQELGQDFFDQAARSINHDKTVLAKLQTHPLAHASGWHIRETQGPDKGWSETSYRGPRLGGKQWQQKNQRLEDDLERMSDSVNVMFKDQGNKRRYQRDEDKLFKEAVSALKTADELYPDSPRGGGGLRMRHADSDFATGGRRAVVTVPLRPPVRPPFSQKVRGYAPNMTEVVLILSGCTMLAAASWVGFTFFRRKSYYDLRSRSDMPDGIEVP